jgi:hypothetical protein
MKALLLSIAIAAATILGGCTYKANVAPTAAAAADIAPGRTVDKPVSYYVSPELASLTRNASEGYVCSANAFPVNAGPAIAASIRNTNDAAFKNIVAGGGMTDAAPSAERHIVFQLEQFTPRIHFEQGWWSATAIANTELAMRVTVYDGHAQEINRSVVAGNGYGEVDGGCDAGAKALETATNQAIKSAMQNYVSRVINGGQI